MRILIVLGMAFTLMSCATVIKPFAITGNEIDLNKMKKSEAKVFFFLGSPIDSTVDLGIDKAVKSGGIKKIYYVDEKRESLLSGVAETITITVYGE